MEKYVYLIWAFLFFILWIILYKRRKDLRKHILWSSILATPIAFVEILWVHKYWSPPSVFNLINTVGIGIEDFLYSFSIGGVVAVLYEFLEKKKDIFSKKHHFHIAFFVFLIAFGVLTFFYPLKPAWNMSISFVLSSLVLIYQRKDLAYKMFFSGLGFAVISIVFILITVKIFYPNYIIDFYIHENLLGLNFIGIPIEEYIFAFTGGAFWSVLYEYFKGYKIK